MKKQQCKFVDAQRDILDKIEACEIALANLYEAFAARLPEMRGFWLGLAREEHGHAVMLRSLEKFLDRDNLFKSLGRFDIAKYQAFVAGVQAQVDGLGEGQLSPERALGIAVACERTPLESKFYKTVKSDLAEFQIIAKHLDTCTREHARLIEYKLTSLLERTRADAGPEAERDVPQTVPPDDLDSPAEPSPPAEKPDPFGWVG